MNDDVSMTVLADEFLMQDKIWIRHTVQLIRPPLRGDERVSHERLAHFYIPPLCTVDYLTRSTQRILAGSYPVLRYQSYLVRHISLPYPILSVHEILTDFSLYYAI